MEDSKFKEMLALINDIVFNISKNAEAKNDVDLKDEIQNAVYIVSKVFTILFKIVNHADQALVGERDFSSQMILWQSGNALISSLQLIRQGYTLEPQILMRNSVENLAMALSFYGVDGDTFYKKFNNLSLSGEKCITAAGKLTKEIGAIYGLLSQIAHPSKKTLGYYYMKERGSLLIGGGVTDNTLHRVKMNLAILNFILVIHWSSCELIFSDYIDNQVFWKKEGKNMVWSPQQYEKQFYTSSIRMFKEALSKQAEIDELRKQSQENPQAK